ncbi:hypothetical protein FNH22_02690 [Fulvivirga sp. M361]|uniref:DUF5367 family protein n=1 Tax=Fulvivirga sp. M361 TaxID=2594266 RepID=UPI001179BC31|nr:DUF5367 family protein [Fulvivirga sp. M361]TRX61705.1 hypothetical protein FNH22_02690 [Fulvivirga sp. M361]
MKTTRAILSGTLVWLLGVGIFTLSDFVVVLPDATLQQNGALSIFLIPFAILGSAIYYKKGHTTHGLIVGAIMVITALVLDAMLTIPFVIIPNGGSYSSFFSSTFTWIIALEYMMIVFFYWVIKVKPFYSRSAK